MLIKSKLNTDENVWFVDPGYGDAVVPLSTNEAFTTGEFVKVPMLIGGNRDVSRLTFISLSIFEPLLLTQFHIVIFFN